MQPQQHALKVYIQYDDGDHQMVTHLYERLSRDGVQVQLRDNASTETGQIIRESNVVIFCISKQFNKAESRTKETQQAFDAVMERTGGTTRLLPVRLENCNVPASLRRWQTVDLFEANGYERLMIALKLNADRVGASVDERDDWRTPFIIPKKKKPQEPIREHKGKSSGRLLFGILLAAAAFTFLFRNVIFGTPGPTPIPADVLAANATQNALEYSRERSSTVTAVALAYSDPLTQTASYLTGVPLSETAAYLISLYTPTPTRTPTPTLSPTITSTARTIAVLPPEIMDGNNVPMVLVPEGGFMMGDDEMYTNVKPAYNIYLLAYYIDKFEVTNAMYRRCVDAGVCQPPKSLGSEMRPAYYGNLGLDGYPVINVDWHMANQFCEWRGARLPTEAEWEKAARGTDVRFYPWGEGTDCSFANYTDPSMVCMGDTAPVGSYKNSTSVYGTFDMAGNVLEWVSSLSVPYPYNAVDGREDLTAPGRRLLRGGSWASPVDWISTVFRLPMDPDKYEAAGNDVGFRCAHDANP